MLEFKGINSESAPSLQEEVRNLNFRRTDGGSASELQHNAEADQDLF